MSPYDRRYTLAALIPEARAAFERLIAYAKARGWKPAIVSAVRTCEEQKGTASKTSRTWHFFGRAIDLELRGAPPSAYAELGAWWEAEGGIWGGRWTTLYPEAPGVPGLAGDVMHFHWAEGETVPEDVWPRAVTDCAEVDRIAENYRRAAGGLVGDDDHGLYSVRLLRVGQDSTRPTRAAGLTVAAGVALGLLGGALGVWLGKAAA